MRFRTYRSTRALPPAAAASLQALLHTIGQRYEASHPYCEQLLRGLLQVLLDNTASLYQVQYQASTVGRTRSQLITSEFRQLVNKHYTTERGLAFYADALCITAKHLAETVK